MNGKMNDLIYLFYARVINSSFDWKLIRLFTVDFIWCVDVIFILKYDKKFFLKHLLYNVQCVLINVKCQLSLVSKVSIAFL